MNLQNQFSAMLRPALLASTLAAGCLGEPPTRGDIPSSGGDACQSLPSFRIDNFESRWHESNPPGLALEAIVRSPYAGQIRFVGAPATSFRGCPLSSQSYQNLPTENVQRGDGSVLVTGLGIPGAYRTASCYSLIQYLSNGCAVMSEPVLINGYP